MPMRPRGLFRDGAGRVLGAIDISWMPTDFEMAFDEHLVVEIVHVLRACDSLNGCRESPSAAAAMASAKAGPSWIRGGAGRADPMQGLVNGGV